MTTVIPSPEIERRLAASTARLFELVPPAELARRICATPDPISGQIRRITTQGVSKWGRNGRIPHDRCLVLELITRQALTRYDMRPDLFGQAPASKVA